jgi:arylsulfatase
MKKESPHPRHDRIFLPVLCAGFIPILFLSVELVIGNFSERKPIISWGTFIRIACNYLGFGLSLFLVIFLVTRFIRLLFAKSSRRLSTRSTSLDFLLYTFGVTSLLILTWINVVLLPYVPLLSAKGVFFSGIGITLALPLSLATTNLLRKAPIVSLGIASGIVILVLSSQFLFYRNSYGVLPGSVQNSPAKKRPPKNVIILLIDDLRADCVSGTFLREFFMPCLDQLAKRGISFKNAYSPSSWTLPSVASLFTSLYPHSHMVLNWGDKLSADLFTIAKAFKQQGYKTAAFSANPIISPQWGFDQGFDYFFNDESFSLKYFSFLKLMAYPLASRYLHTPIVRLRHLNSAEKINNAVIKFLDYIGKERFFLYVHYMDCHEYFADSPPKFLLPEAPTSRGFIALPKEKIHPFLSGHSENPDPTTKQLLFTRYKASVMYLDEQLGVLIDSLKKHGLLQDSLIIITADHGEEFFEHGGRAHRMSLFREVLHVPLILLNSDLAEPGTVIQTPVSLLDIFPMLTAWLGISLQATVHGKALESTIHLPRNEGSQEAIYSELILEDCQWYSLIRDGYQLIEVAYDNRLHLFFYDLNADPGEQHNLAETQPPSGFLEELQLKRDYDTRPRPPADRKLTEEQKRILRSLGYIARNAGHD